MNIAKTDFYRLRELLAEKGLELTPEELMMKLSGQVGILDLTNEKGICEMVGRGNELENRWFEMMVKEIILESKTT